MGIKVNVNHKRIPLGKPDPKPAVTVASTSTIVLLKNGSRTHAIIQASWSNTEPLFLSFGDSIPAMVDYGFAVYPGQHYKIGPDNYTSLTINAICTSGGMTAYVFEA